MPTKSIRDTEVPEYHLAQLNIAKMKTAIDAPEMTDFVNRLEDVNALADAAPGFVWRLQTEDGDATAINFFGPEYLVNMSVWENCESLHDYVYRSDHKDVLARRKEWFERMLEAYSVMWWIPAGSIPTLEEAAERLESLQTSGPSAQAFTFKRMFPRA
jgi:hypothetical protein